MSRLTKEVAGLATGAMALLWVMQVAVHGGAAIDTHEDGSMPAERVAPAQGAASAPPEVKVAIAGFRIVGPSIGPSDFGERTAFNESPGIGVALAVSVPAGVTLLDADDDASVVETWVDDKGTDLSEDASFGFSPDFTGDQTALLLTLTAAGRPAADARAFTVKGTLAVTTARGETTARAAKVALTKGTTFKAGATAYTVNEIEKDGDETFVTLSMTRDAVDRIKALRFLDAGGKEIEGSLSMRGYSMDTGEVMYRVSGAPSVATVEVVQHDGLHTQQVPFSFEVTLGSVR